VTATDQVVVAGQQRLRDGARVKLVDAEIQHATMGGAKR